MKLKQWLYGATALAMLSACSESDLKTGKDVTVEKSSGYIGVKIQLPTAPLTRGINDSFDDGEASEYSIKDSYILLFQGSSETNAVCIGTFDLKDSDNPKNSDNQVTVTSNRVADVSNIDQTKKLYALVILNAKANEIFLGNNKEWKKGKKIQDLQEEIITNRLFTQKAPGNGIADAIFMTNSPLSPYRGGDKSPNVDETGKEISDIGKLPVLVELNNEVYKTEKEALDKPAGIIHVERAVGKVTCSAFPSETGIEVDYNGTKYKLVVDKVWWDMAQDLSNSFLVRNTDRYKIGNTTNKLWTWDLSSSNINDAYSSQKYRMIGSTQIKSKGINEEEQIFYRPYFCQVPGYGESIGDDDLTYEKKSFVKTEMVFDEKNPPVAYNKDNAFYPRENTFPVEYMKYANTTRIGFWVTFKLDGGPDIAGKNFYIKGVDKSTLYTDDLSGNNPLENLAIKELSDAAKYPKIYEAVTTAAGTNTITDLNIADLIDIKSVTDPTNGEVKITNISFKPMTDKIYQTDKYYNKFVEAPDSKVFNNLVAQMNNLGQFYQYTKGRAFYEVRIKHFGNELTPWVVAEDKAASNIEESYGTEASRAANYLGRYGVVRNNWYDLVIKEIKKLGHPEDPERWDINWPDKPDDNKDNYITVELRVLSWAKRTQEHWF